MACKRAWASAPARSGPTRHGETVTLVVRVRNVGKEEVKFQYLREFFIENPPTVTDGEGKPVRLGRVSAFGTAHPGGSELGTGEGNRALRIEARTRAGKRRRHTQGSEHLWNGEVPASVRAGSWKLVGGRQSRSTPL